MMLIKKPIRPTEKPKTFNQRIDDLNGYSDELQYFNYDHLPDFLQEVSKPFGELALAVIDRTTEHDAMIQAKRAVIKLLEAKDCAVRAALANKNKDN